MNDRRPNWYTSSIQIIFSLEWWYHYIFIQSFSITFSWFLLLFHSAHLAHPIWALSNIFLYNTRVRHYWALTAFRCPWGCSPSPLNSKEEKKISTFLRESTTVVKIYMHSNFCLWKGNDRILNKDIIVFRYIFLLKGNES